MRIYPVIAQYTDDQDQHSFGEAHTTVFQFVTICNNYITIQPAGERDHHIRIILIATCFSETLSQARTTSLKEPYK